METDQNMTTANLANPGTLIRARGREWVVLPSSKEDFLLVKPLGGLDEEITGIIPVIEPVESATFPLPTKEDVGDFRSGRLLRDAARLSTRASAGPFRSFGRIAAEPRSYQLVPLMMALKLDPVRLLIADDVGIGKTIEAAVIARELLDRGEIRRMAVLCPPHLAEQWQKELLEKFHIDAELVLSSTVQRLERDLPLGQSVFDRYPFTVVSMDFIKSSRRVEDFVNKCPEFVIVDEAHGCTLTGGAGRSRQQRYELLKRISEDKSRHVLLVTATPHSGNEGAFRSLMGLLDRDFRNLPSDLEKAERESIRKDLARHLVQRKRADIRHYLDQDTSFPDRFEKEVTYKLSDEYRDLFRDIMRFTRDFVSDGEGGKKQRIRYWSALALLRCLSSSPAAAVATLRSRSRVDEESDQDVDEVGIQTVLDRGEEETDVVIDLSPGADSEEAEQRGTRSKLREFAKRIEAIPPNDDTKYLGLLKEVKGLLRYGFRPIVFCRFVDTAEYVAARLRNDLAKKVQVESVTGRLPPTEREARIAALADSLEEYVLVCTDCLSEGINLQDNFDSVIHYDLAWNPTRHEQREGRVDRFGQSKPEIRVLTYFGDNPVDKVILEVLLRKHNKIKSDLGVTVSVPGSSEQVIELLFQGALFREWSLPDPMQQSLPFDYEDDPRIKELHDEWDRASDREKASRSIFAQNTLSPDAVAAELEKVRNAIGRSKDVERFFNSTLAAAAVPVVARNGIVTVHLSNEVPRSLRQALQKDEPFSGRFDLPIGDGESYLGRTSPIVEGLASWTLDQAIDRTNRDGNSVASRCGVVVTSRVESRTLLLVLRFRYHLKNTQSETILCEEIVPLACRVRTEVEWLPDDIAEELLEAEPEGRLVETAINSQLDFLFGRLPVIRESLNQVAVRRSDDQLAAHEEVRAATRERGRVSIEPVMPVDVLGAYVLLPVH